MKSDRVPPPTRASDEHAEVMKELKQFRESMATMQANMATMQANMATMQANMATKAEVAVLAADIAELKANMATKAEVAELKANMATKAEVAELKANMATNNADVMRRLDMMAPVLAAGELEPYVLKLFGEEAASGIDGGTWTILRSDDRLFAVSALHVTTCYKLRNSQKLLMVLPPSIVKAAKAIGVYDRALTTRGDDRFIPNHLDVVVIELDAAKAPQMAQMALGIDAAAEVQVPRDTPVVGWSEQMPLSGSTRGATDGVQYMSEGDGCVPGNSGTCVFAVRHGAVIKTRPLGVYVSSVPHKRGVVVPLPKTFPAVRGALVESDSGGAPPHCGEFQFVKVCRDTKRTVRVSEVMGRQVRPQDAPGVTKTLSPTRYVKFSVTAEVFANLCVGIPAAGAARRGRSPT